MTNQVHANEQVAPAPEKEITLPENEEELAALLEEPKETEEEGPTIEYKGKKLKVDPEVKAAWDDWQGEFTRGRMDYSAKEKALAEREAQANQALMFQASIIKERAQLESLDSQLAEFAKVTPQQWEQAYASNEKEAAAAERTYNRLKAQRAEMWTTMQGKAQQWMQGQQQTIAQQRAAADKELALKVKGWSPQKATELVNFVSSKYGYTPEQIANHPLARDPGMVQAMLDLMTVQQALERGIAKRKAAAQQTEAAPVVPIAPTKTRGSASGGTQLRDDQSPETWAKNFNKLMANAKRR